VPAAFIRGYSSALFSCFSWPDLSPNLRPKCWSERSHVHTGTPWTCGKCKRY